MPKEPAFTLPEKPSRADVLLFICRAASYGNLGAFVGAGFSKAVLKDAMGDIALSWGELLEQCCVKLKVDFKPLVKQGVSYPDLASSICAAYSDKKDCPYSEALTRLKYTIAELTSWYPEKKSREVFSKYLSRLNPKWIITTNYDLVIESLLTGKSVPLGPNDPLSARTGVVPVYHLHGVRTNPEELIIAQEDYVALFRPNEYRQIKLALTIKESTTLILGYGLGDVNVLTALDWSKNVFKNAAANYPNGLIQVFRAASPKQKPYLDRNGIVIVEASNLEAFFDELLEVQEKYAKEYGEQQESLKQFAKELDSADKGIVDHFIDDEDFRDGVLEELSQYPIDLIAGFVSLLDKCIEETWARSSPGGAFEGYNENLVLLVDILEAFPMNKIPPALFQTVAYSLNRVSGMVAEHWGQFGKSWSAGTTWSKRKGDLKVETVKELRAVSKQHGYFGLQRLLEDLPV